MPDENGTATVICPTCHNPNKHPLGWLKTVAVWDCSFCGAALELDYAELTKFLASSAAATSNFTARLSPRPNRGITTRRTR